MNLAVIRLDIFKRIKMSNNFREHGKARFEVSDNIVIVRMDGAFNEYGFITFVKKMKKVVEGFKGEQFSILMNMVEAAGGTPELRREAEKYNAWLNTQNMAAKAVVIECSVTLDIFKARVKNIKGQNMQSFKNEAEAIHWLQTQMQTATNKEKTLEQVK